MASLTPFSIELVVYGVHGEFSGLSEALHITFVVVEPLDAHVDLLSGGELLCRKISVTSTF
jgi:hypothetical protein